MKKVWITFFSLVEEEIGDIRSHYSNVGISFSSERGENYEDYFMLHLHGERGGEELVPPGFAEKVLAFDRVSIGERLKTVSLEKDVKISVAESCTGGAIADLITGTPGSSDYFLGGVVAYSNALKVDVLGVSEMTIESGGAVSPQVAEEMARGIAGLTGTEFSLSSTGIAGPSGGSPEKPVGTVWFGFNTPEGTRSLLGTFQGQRREIKRRAASKGLFELIKAIEGSGQE